MTSHPYIYFPGTAEEAFNFYAKTLGGKIAMMMKYSEAPPTPMTPSAEFGDKVMHACFQAPGLTLLTSDAIGDQYKKPVGFDLALDMGSVEEAERVFAAFAEGGEVTMPIQETFWAFRFGKLKDRFGIPWMISATKPMPAE